VAADEERWRRLSPGEVSSATVSFAGGMPDSALFPTEAFRQVLNRVVRDEGDVLLQYYPARGYPPLRQYLARYLLRFGVEASADEILIANGGVLHRRAERRMTYGELIKAKGSPIRVEGYYNDRSKVHEASMCTQVAEVEVDPETGQVKLKKLTNAHHTGTILNPLMHQGQIEGGTIMGVGYALMEHLMVDGGKVITANFGDYKIPTIQDIPDLKTVVKEAPTGPGPYHSMAIGETAIIPVAAAVANAVEDAIGVRIKSLPITAEDVFEALNRKRIGKAEAQGYDPKI